MASNKDVNSNSPPLEVKKGDDDEAPEQPSSVPEPTAPPTSSRRSWKILGGLMILCILVFAVVFPTTYVLTKDDDSSDDVDSEALTGDLLGQSSTDIDDHNINNNSNTTTNNNTKNTTELETNPMDETDPVTSTTSDEFVSADDDALQVRLALFTPAITAGYSSMEELEEDLTNAARFLVNNVIRRNIEALRNGGWDGGLYGPQPVFEQAPVDGATDSLAADGSAAAAASPVANDFSDFGTNNQEANVEEGDQIVSDGENVFAAYGDTIVLWNAVSGEIQLELKMPADILQNITDDLRFFQTRSEIAPPIYYNPKPLVRHLLLHNDRLLVVVDAGTHRYEERAYPILNNYLGTHVRLYKIVTKEAGLLELVSTSDLTGYFAAVRSVDGSAHVVTTTGVDTYTDLVTPFDLYNFGGLTEVQYLNETQRIATKKAIPTFVKSIMTELGAGPSFPNLFRISLMQTEASGEQHLERFAFADGIINSLTQVHSFDMTSDADEIAFSVSGAFLPTYSSQVYGATNVLVISGEGWEHNPVNNTSTQSTHLLGVAIDGASSAPHSVGKVEGYILNSRSVDVMDNILRVATTVRENTWWWFPIPIDTVIVLEAAADEEDAVGDEITIPPQPELPPPEPSTQNFVITLNMTASGGVMQQLGRIQLGKPNEVFTAVRFFDNVAYAVTFERRDPLYVLDLTDPVNPFKIAELDVSGFSSYLHPMNEENTMILAIGEEADNNGTILGLQITIFDMRNPADPKVAHRHVIEKDINTQSSSDALWDFLAVRYASERLMIPIDIYDWENVDLEFHGFAVFIANEAGISESCRISQSSPRGGGFYCYSCDSSLPRRSMIFNGDLMTTGFHRVAMTDLETCTENWTIDLYNRSNSDQGYCCF